jgi:hypothetical protein
MKPALEDFVYRPRFRQVSYLVGLLTKIFEPDGFTLNRGIRAPATQKPMRIMRLLVQSLP